MMILIDTRSILGNSPSIPIPRIAPRITSPSIPQEDSSKFIILAFECASKSLETGVDESESSTECADVSSCFGTEFEGGRATLYTGLSGRRHVSWCLLPRERVDVQDRAVDGFSPAESQNTLCEPFDFSTHFDRKQY